MLKKDLIYLKKSSKNEQNQKAKDIRFEKEAKALQKNLLKRKKQQEEREKLKKLKEQNNG